MSIVVVRLICLLPDLAAAYARRSRVNRSERSMGAPADDCKAIGLPNASSMPGAVRAGIRDPTRGAPGRRRSKQGRSPWCSARAAD